MYKTPTSSVSLVTEASTFAVTTSEAKDHLRVDISTDDTLIGNLVQAATEYAEIYTGRSFAQRTYRVDLPFFADEVWLPNGPVLAVSSVKYYDTASPEALQTWAASNYTLHNDVLYRNDGISFPSVGTQPDNVQITYTVGYLDNASPQVENIPQTVKSAVLLLVGDLYENREAQILYPGQILENRAFKMLLQPYRVFR